MKHFFLLCTALVATTALWAADFEVDGIAYNKLGGDSVEVSSKSPEYSGSVTIPPTITNNKTTYRVTSIGDGAFHNSRSLTSITIPNSVTSIGDGAFYCCTSLTSITIPNSVTSIGGYAFYLDKNIVYSGTATGSPWGAQCINGYVDGYLVYTDATKTKLVGCSAAAIGSITIPNSVTSIGNYAFYGCTSLTSITIPQNVTIIESEAFYSCSVKSVTWNAKNCNACSLGYQVETLSFGKEVEVIPLGIFNDISHLTSINVDAANTHYSSIDGVLFNYAKDTLIHYPIGNKSSTYTIPNSVTYIGSHAFEFSDSLTSITIPKNVTSIGDWAFDVCSSLTSIVIPNSVTNIGKYIFAYCTSLTSVSMPNSVISIEEGAFSGCTSLISVIIPNSVISIGGGAFSDCTSIISLTIPNSVTSIGSAAFAWVNNIIYSGIATGSPWGAKSINGYIDGDFIFSDSTKTILCGFSTILSGHVQIPNGVIRIGERAFCNCTQITSVTLSKDVTTIDASAFAGCSSLVTVKNPNGLKKIGDNAFYSCSKLSSINMPNSLDSIGEDVFSSCYQLPVINGLRYADRFLVGIENSTLTECQIKDDTRWIGNHAFRYGWNLTTIVIPDSVISIAMDAFSSCYALASVTLGGAVDTVSVDMFKNCSNLQSLKVVTGNKKYDSRNNCNAIIETSTNTLVVGCRNTKIPMGITTIGDNAFYYACPISVEIPSAVVKIGSLAFSNKDIQSITCFAETPPSARPSRSIPGGSFLNVNKSIPVYVPVNCSKAYENAWGWKEFTNIIPALGRCGDNLFWKYINHTLTIIGTGSMYNFSFDNPAPWHIYKDSVTLIELEEGIHSIGDFAFYGFENKELKTIDIPNSVTSIGRLAFSNCSWLKTINIGTGLEDIRDSAFILDQRLIYINCLAVEPPLLGKSPFVNYLAYVKVPCDALDEYKVSLGWSSFSNISCITAEEVPTVTDVVTTPTDNSVTITWPTNTDANDYTIVIKKDGEVFCTLTFNAQGQLMNIAFAPGRGTSNDVALAEAVAGGYRFTITSLNPGTTYTYVVDTKDAGGTSIANYTGSFTTTAPTALDEIWGSQKSKVEFQKVMIDGRMYILREGKMYNAVGEEVR